MEVTPLRLRKNKLRPSCESCRLSKLACDHAQPCGRCLRRRRECVYSEAPMTKVHGVSSSPRVPSKRAHPQDDSLPSERLDETGDPLALLNHESYHTRDDLDLGFMGETSHAAIIIEAGLVEAQRQNTNPDDKAPSSAQLRLQRISKAILSMLPSPDVAVDVLDGRGLSGVHAEIWLVLIPYQRRFFQLHQKALLEPRTIDSLVALGETLSRNTKRPLGIPKTNEEWIDNVTGVNSRWEGVGFMLLGLAVVAWNILESDPIYRVLEIKKKGGKRGYACRMLEFVLRECFSRPR